MRSRRWLVVCGWGAIGALALCVRLRGIHRGLIYPDGYQYLLMARGIAGHVQPTVRLGHGGALFVPSVDAALKPLFPALAALLSPVSGIRGAADALTALGGAATVLLVGVTCMRLTGSLASAALGAGAALMSPALSYWSGFTGPDPLAQALALATALALLGRRPRAAGALGALCALTRPEWLLVFLGAGFAALSQRELRTIARSALLAGAFTLAMAIAVLRPPLAVPPGGLAPLIGGLAAGFGAQLAALRTAREPSLAVLAVGAALALLVACRVSHASAAIGQLAREQWPVLALAGWGLLRACRTGHARFALMLLASMGVLGATYLYRNAGSERYLTQLLPLASVAAGFVLAPLPERSGTPRFAVRGAVAAAALAATAMVAPSRPPLATDTFAALAGQLAAAPRGTLVSAAPDAYGYLLPGRAQRPLRPGARGLILLDGAQRAYASAFSARGAVVARLWTPAGFLRPDGRLDTAPALLIRGVVTSGR